MLKGLHSSPKKILTLVSRSIILFTILVLIGSCSVDENIVKECGREHPNSLWGQFLCQHKRDREVAEFKERLRLEREAEIRRECVSNFINSDFPNKSKIIYELVKNNFDKDINLISEKLASELNLEAGGMYTKGESSSLKGSNRPSDLQKELRRRKYSPFKSIDYSFKNRCNLTHPIGVATIDFDNVGNLVSMDIHAEWKGADDKIVIKKLEEFTHPKYGNPAKNKRILGENLSLISVLEKRFGKYDRAEGCFYFAPRQVLKSQALKKILNGWEPEDAFWDEEQNFCFVVDNASIRKTGEDQELSLILIGSPAGDRGAHAEPGIVSAHTFLIGSSGYVEKSQSFLAVGDFATAPAGWEPIAFSKSGPTGWVNKNSACSQGCTEYVTFLVPDGIRFWKTHLQISSWDGNKDIDRNFFKVKYQLVAGDYFDRKFPLKLELKGLKAGKPIDKSILIQFDSIKKQYVVPEENFYPNNIN